MTMLQQVHLRFSFTALIAIGVVVATATVAHATKFWKNSVVTGNWSAGNNWSAVNQASTDNGGVPVAGEHVVITHSDGTARTVTLDTSTPALGLVYLDLTGAGTAADTLSIASNVSLTAGAGFSVGGNNGFAFTNGRGAVNQSNGTVTISPGWDLILAWGAGSTGTYTLSGGALVANQSEWVGYNGTGTFNHSGGTNTINANGIVDFFVGATAGSMGTYNLSGTGQLISNESEYIGYSGTGHFNQSGGTNTIRGAGNDLYLGYNTGSLGNYTLTGGTLSVDNNLIVGNSGTGTLNVATGGSLSSDSASIGRWIGSEGNVLVSGAGSTWTNNNDLFVADQGLGTLMVTGGADISSHEANIGNFAGSSGSVVVDGAGSSWTATAPFGIYIGRSGAASLTIASGGQVSQTSGSTHVGALDGSYGNVTVQGAGSTWTIAGALALGGHAGVSTGGDGYMTIRDGAQVVSNTGYVGYSSGSNSGVTVERLC
jgi:T5SS/PEP-CTERM-associated repeat protein